MDVWFLVLMSLRSTISVLILYSPILWIMYIVSCSVYVCVMVNAIPRVANVCYMVQLPTEIKLNYFDGEGNMKEISVGELTKGKKVVLFAVPGAFTPTCSLKHLPGFIENADELKSKGVDTIACVSVNDAFVMDAWGKAVGADGKVLMLADGSALFAKAIGADLDLTDKGLGMRSRRYAMLVDDSVVKVLNLEEGGAFTVSSAEDILSAL